MDIQAKINRIAAIIESLPENGQYQLHSPVSKELFALSEDNTLPKSIRGFCHDLSLLTSDNPFGPLGNLPKQKIREAFARTKV